MAHRPDVSVLISFFTFSKVLVQVSVFIIKNHSFYERLSFNLCFIDENTTTSDSSY